MEEFLQAGILNNIGEFVLANPFLGFIALGLVFIVRGETAILLSVFLVMKGYISWFELATVSILSLIVGDNLLYLFGRLTRGTKFSLYIERKLSFLTTFRSYINRHFIKIILLVKYTIGLSLITMLLSGWAGIKFKKFFLWHAVAMVVWTAVMSAVSYSFISGLGYLQTAEILGKIEFGILGAIALFIIIEIIVQKTLKTASTREAAFTRIGKVIEKTKLFVNGKNKNTG